MEKKPAEIIDPAYYQIRHEGTMRSVYFKSYKGPMPKVAELRRSPQAELVWKSMNKRKGKSSVG